MKKLLPVLLGLLVILSHSVLYSAETDGVTVSPIFKGELVQLVALKGGSLRQICGPFLESEDRWREIARINRLTQPDKIKPGTKIFIPLVYLKGVPLAGKVTAVQGTALVQPGGSGPWTPLNRGDAVLPGSNLKTGPDSLLEIAFEDGSSFLLRSDTELGVRKALKVLDAGLWRELYLGSGRVLTKVKEVTGEAPRFKIHTPSAIASVRGTEFRVAVDGAQQTYAEVLARVVSVSAAETTVDVAEGEGTVVKKGEPPSPPTKLLPPPAPRDLEAIYNTAPAIAFTDVEGARAYRILIAHDPQGMRPIREKVIPLRERFTVSGLDDGHYWLLAQSIDAVGLEGSPSVAYPFAIRVNPLPPMIQSPRDKAKVKGTAAEFEWLSVSDAVRYHLQVAEDREFGRIVSEKTDLKETSFKTGTLEYRPYHFRIRSIAADRYEGPWSDPLGFDLMPLPPTPAMDQPAMARDEIHLMSKDLGKGFTYRFQVAGDSLFSQILVDRKTEKPEITFKKPTKPGIYSVRIAAVDPDGDAGAFSPPQRFEIKEGFPFELLGGWFSTLMLFLLW